MTRREKKARWHHWLLQWRYDLTDVGDDPPAPEALHHARQMWDDSQYNDCTALVLYFAAMWRRQRDVTTAKAEMALLRRPDTSGFFPPPSLP